MLLIVEAQSCRVCRKRDDDDTLMTLMMGLCADEAEAVASELKAALQPQLNDLKENNSKQVDSQVCSHTMNATKATTGRCCRYHADRQPASDAAPCRARNVLLNAHCIRVVHRCQWAHAQAEGAPS